MTDALRFFLRGGNGSRGRVVFLALAGLEGVSGHDGGGRMLMAKLDVRVGPLTRAQALQPVAHVRFIRLGRDRARLDGGTKAAFRREGPFLQVHRAFGAVNGEVDAGRVPQTHAPIKEKTFRIIEQGMKRVRGVTPVFPDVNPALGGGAGRVFGARDHVDGIRVVSHPEARQAVGGVAVELPLAQEPGVEGPLGEVEQEALPIHVGFPAIARVARPTGFIEVHGGRDAADLAQDARGEPFCRRLELAFAAALGARLDDTRVGAGQVQSLVGAGEVNRHRFLDIDILACLEGRRENGAVAEIRGGDDDGVHVLEGEQIIEAGELAGLLAELVLDAFGGGQPVLLPDIADRSNLDILLRGESKNLSHQEGPAATDTNTADGNFVIGAGCAAHHQGADAQQGGAGAGGMEELPAGELGLISHKIQFVKRTQS